MPKNRISFRDRLRTAIRGWSVGYIPDLKGWSGANNIDYGVTVTEDTALRFTAVYAAIKLLAENIAALPKSVKKETPEGFEDASDHAAYKLLRVAPNSYMDPFTFWFLGVSTLLGKGNFFAVIERNKAGKPVALHPVDPDWVEIRFINGVKGYQVNTPEPSRQFLNGTYLEHEMIHVMLFTRNGLTGIDPISYNAGAIGRGIATQKFSADFYRRGGQIKGTLETDGELGDDQYDNFMRHYNNAAANFETPLLEYGIKYKSVGISPVAAQLIQTETMSIDDIARIFCIPPHLLAELSHATFSNIEQQNIHFAEFSLRPICKRIEVQLESKLFMDAERGRYSVKFDLKGLMRGDAAARATYYTSGISAGWMTPNEARRLEEMKALPGLDSPRMPMNFVQIDDEGNAVVVDNSTKDEE